MEKEVFDLENKRTWNKSLKGLDDFKKYYTHIKCYHACKPRDVKSYYENGILLPRELSLESYIMELPGFTEQHESMLNIDSQDNNVYFALDKRYLLEKCGNYLIYGSELIIGIAVNLDGTHSNDNMDYLKSQGKPTIFTCELPIKDIDELYLKDIVEYIAKWNTEDISDRVIITNKPVEVANIIDHEHPNPIWDHVNGSDYKW